MIATVLPIFLFPGDRSSGSVSSGRDDDSASVATQFILSFVALAMLLAAEWLPISVFVHTSSGGQSAARGMVAFLSIFLAFGYLRNKHAIRLISREVNGFHFSAPFFGFHVCFMAVFLVLCLSPIRGRASGAGLFMLTCCWYAAGASGIVSAAFTFFTPRIWARLFRATGNLWIYAVSGGAISWALVTVSWSGWNNPSVKPVTDVTFRFVLLLLRPFLPNLVGNRADLSITAPRFSVIVGDACSGLEGAGLILAFTIVWLWLFRRECRFPRALLVIPAGIVVMFVLNGVRIAALILIGNAGAPQVAMGGFHSQAGWIAFNAVALGCCVVLPRVTWLGARTHAPTVKAAAGNPTIPYLLPFVCIVAAGMISRGASAGFEWLYALRFLAAAAALWSCRRSYRDLKWKTGWEGAVAGLIVFVFWVALDRGPHADNGIASGLALLPATARRTWIVFRTLAATVTVPLAEELAFRGFLLRRFVSADFESVNLRRFTWIALLGSSVIFGLMHGERWIAGTLAGLVYAMVMLRRGSIGDSVVAHAVTNAMLAALVLAGGRWYLW